MNPPTGAAADPIMERLEDQIAWYDTRSRTNKHYFKYMKVTEIVAAALIPFLSTSKFPHVLWVVGALGVVITVLEGLLQLNQNQQNWIAYRATSEALKHEKYIYLGRAAPYSVATDPRALLAERVESIVSQENSKWVAITRQVENPKQP